MLPHLILASGSPRRRELLSGLDLDFTVRPVDLDETPRPDEPPKDYVQRLAREKAESRAEPGEVVLAADTIVVLDDRLLGKPEDPADARAMLGRMVGREHTVLTGVAVLDPARSDDGLALDLDVSQVRLASMSPEDVAWYVDTGEPLDKAGSYAIQGLGALFVEAVEGNYTNVVGLPLPLTFRLFGELGWDLRRWRVGSGVHRPEVNAPDDT